VGGSKGSGGAGGAVGVCWVREKERIDWVCVSSLGMLGEKEWEEE
jgi:hypothetical protein